MSPRHQPPNPSEVAIRSERSAYAEAIPPGDVTASCRGPVRVCAVYDDHWRTPVTMAPVWITDRSGVVLAGGARTQGLPSFGMQDGDEIDGVRPELGPLLFSDAVRGAVGAELRAEPDAAAQVASLEAQILEELRGFTASMETALQPWILAWEDQGWLGAAKVWFSGAKRGMSAWWEGEKDFWAAVGDWLSSLPAMLGDAWNSLSSAARALWDNKDRIVQLLQDLATGSVEAFQRGIEALKDALAAIPGLEEIAETFRLLVEKSAEWAGAMNEMVIQSPRILAALGATMLGVVMLTTPNFWAEMIGTGAGFLLPEIILAIIFAIIAFFTVGTGGAALAARLTAFVARVTTQLTQLGHAAGRVILRMFQGIASIAGKMGDLIRAQRRNRAEKAQGTTDSEIEVTRPVPQRAKMAEGIGDHIKKRDPDVPRKRGIGGAHDKHEFEAALRSEGGEVVSRTPHPDLPGAERVDYRMGALDAAGQPTGELRNQVFTKTVYDPSIVPDGRMMQWGQEAADSAMRANGGSLPREWSGLSNNGVRIRGYTNTSTGEVTSFFPEI